MLIIIPDARFDGPADIEQEAAGEAVEVRPYQAKSLDDIPDEVWAEADGMLIWGVLRCDRALLDRTPKLRVVSRMGVGFDVIDIEECGRRSIPACNVPDYGTTDVADHAIGLMLALSRGIVRHHEALREDPVGNFRAIGTPIMRRLRGRTFAIIGLGRIGTAAGLRARAFGMRVMFYDPYLLDGADLAVGFERCESLEELLGEADVVSCHTPLTEETRGMINGQTLSVMKQDAILINTSRGEVVDVDAVTVALKENRIAAAGLDVLPQEPPDPKQELFRALKTREAWTVGRVILTPHAAWFSPDGATDLRSKAARNLAVYLAGGPIRNVVNQDHLAQ